MPLQTTCKYCWTIFEKDGFRIASYKACSPLTLPNGNEVLQFRAKGNCPTNKNVTYNLIGEFEKYKEEYTLKIDSFDELLPTEEDAIIAYLQTLEGVGKKTAEKLFEEFGITIFSVMENNPSSLSKVRGITEKKAVKIGLSYAERHVYKELFEYLYRFKISDSAIFKYSKLYGSKALENVKNDPFSLMEMRGITFYVSDRIAQSEGITGTNPKRVRAAILEVLKEGEEGGSLFGFTDTYPDFVYHKFLKSSIFDILAAGKATSVTGSTYLTYPVLYLKLLCLLNEPLSESDFQQNLAILEMQKKIYLMRGESNTDTKIFSFDTAQAELNSAEYLKKILNYKVISPSSIEDRIDIAESRVGIRLSNEQKNAVRQSLANSISIITGGPGTGKTSILKVIIDVFANSFPNKHVVLAAPTGRAAKRMNDATGYPSSTIHSLLSLRSDFDNLDSKVDITDSLIIVDESSMIGIKVLCNLLSSVGTGSQIIFVGDIDQLPSVEVGNCLTDMITSGCIPVSKLTQTYRQASGSNIILNCQRIKRGETQLDYGQDFKLYQKENSLDIADTVSKLYLRAVKKFGIDNVIVLSPFYKNTQTGVKALNEKIRKDLRPDLDSFSYFERLGIRYYEQDRIMFTKNTLELTNGDIGVIDKIIMASGKPLVLADFDGKIIELEGEDLDSIRLAYALTVHKSQGGEWSCAIIVVDNKHNVMSKRNLIYTSVSRAKQYALLVGQEENVTYSIIRQDDFYRNSVLSLELQNR